VNFSTPIQFLEAITQAEERDLLPLPLSSEEIREQLSSEIRTRSIFSARTTNGAYVDKIGKVVERLLSPQTESGQRVSFAQMREDLQGMLQELGYDPERGFPGDDELGIPPAAPGSLRDLGSDQRLNLLLETQVRQMLGAGYRIAGQEPLRLEAFPCWELVRIYDRNLERDDWSKRWQEAGGQFFDGGRMIARKDDPVWDELGSSANFDDGLDNPYPPFAFNSGMGVIEVDRDEAIELGVIAEDEQVGEIPVELNKELKAQAGKFGDDILAELERELGNEASRLITNRGVDKNEGLRNRLRAVLEVLPA